MNFNFDFSNTQPLSGILPNSVPSPDTVGTAALPSVPVDPILQPGPVVQPVAASVQPGQTPKAPHLLFIDRLVLRYQLSDQHRYDLIQLHTIATRGNVLEPAEVMARIFLLAMQYGSEKRLIDRLNALDANSNGGADIRGLLTELAVRLEDTWAITNEQKKSVRVLCQEQIYMAGRTKFKTLSLDVNAMIKLKPAAYRLENVVGRHHRETKLTAFVKAMSSNVRNTFRQELKRGLFEKKICTVEQFVLELSGKYHLSRGKDGSSQALIIQFVLLRRFARDHSGLLETAQEELEEDTSAEERRADKDGEPPAKRQKTSAGRGRIGDGQDFWSQVDAWFQKKIEAWGDKFSSDKWTEFITESTQQDNEFINTAKKSTKAKVVAQDPSSDDISGMSAGGSASDEGGHDSWLEGLY